MSVSDGQLANDVTFNTSFMSREVDDNTIGVKDFENTDTASGPSVFNIQREVNSLNAYTGRPSASAHDATPVWTNSYVGTGTDTLKARAEALTLEFSAGAGIGHAHTGVNGEGPLLEGDALTGFPEGEILFGGPSDTTVISDPLFAWDTALSSLTAQNVVIPGTFAINALDSVVTGDVDDLDTSTNSVIRLTGAVTSLRGIANGADGKLVYVINATGSDFDVLNQDANPTAADRIITGTGADVPMVADAVFQFQYDATTARWRIVGGTGSGGAGQQITFTVANNQVAAADVTGAVYDKVDVKAVRIPFDLERSTATQNYQQVGFINLTHDTVDDAWRIHVATDLDLPINMGVTFSVTSAGQLQYTSSNLAGGSYAGTLRLGGIVTFAQ